MNPSPAQLFDACVGLVLTVLGIAGLASSADFTTGHAVLEGSHRGLLIGAFDVNGWLSVVHLASGLAALAAARSYDGARVVAALLAALYTVLAIAGLAANGARSYFGLFATGTGDNILHVVIAVLAITATFVTPSVPDPSSSAAEEGAGFRYD